MINQEIETLQSGGAVKQNKDVGFRPVAEHPQIVMKRNYVKTQQLRAKMKQDAEAREIKRRENTIATSHKINKEKGEFSKEALANSSMGEKWRFFKKDPNSFIDEYINPFKMIGDMGDNLGKAFFDDKATLTDKALAVGTPLAAGALAGLGTTSNKQFINNVLNPAAGLAPNKSILNWFKKDKWGDHLPDPKQWLKDWNDNPVMKNRRKIYEILDPVYNYKRSLNTLTGETTALKTSRESFPFKDVGEAPVKNYLSLLKDKGINQWFDKLKNSVGVSYYDDAAVYVKKAGSKSNNVKTTTVHELTHNFENNGRSFNQIENEHLLEPFGLDIPSFNKSYADNPTATRNYYTTPTEIHARMNEARYQMGMKPTDEFTAEHFDRAMKANFLGMGPYIKNKGSMIRLMNEFYTPAAVVGGGALLIPKEKANTQ